MDWKEGLAINAEKEKNSFILDNTKSENSEDLLFYKIL